MEIKETPTILSHLEIVPVANVKQHFWKTARGSRLPVKSMSTEHIKNCIRCFLGKGNMRIPVNYLGGRKKWLEIFNDELISRQ
jgi:hypothetical protein